MWFALDWIDYNNPSATWVNALPYRAAPIGRRLNASRCATVGEEAWGQASIEGLRDSGLLAGMSEQDRWLLKNELRLKLKGALPEGGLRLATGHTEALDAPFEGLLSIVATTRNDDHGGRMTERMQCFVNGIAEQAERYDRPVELILVEWNPPQDRPRLAEALRWPKAGGWLDVRIVTVPPQLHDRFVHARSLPLYQMIAKNAGIRRARGEYILATNVDILFDDALFEIITDTSKLQPGKIYRSDRWDIPPDLMDCGDIRTIRDLAPRRTTCVNAAAGSVAPADFQQGNQAQPETSGAYRDNLSKPDLHLNACGDFQLMDRQSWHRLRGYVEFDGFSIHIDSLLGYCAFAHGVEEVRLPSAARHFHIDHSGGWSTDTKAISDLTDGLKKKKIEALHFQELSFFVFAMLLLKAPFDFNREGWGLARFPLPETNVTPAVWRKTNAALDHPLSVHDGGAFYDPLLFDRTGLEACLQKNVGKHLNLSVALTLGHIRKQADHRQRPLYLWGAGQQGQVLAREFIRRGIAVAGFIHGQDTPVNIDVDLPVFRPGDLRFEDTPERPYVVIASVYQTAIAENLRRLGALPDVDFIARA